MPTNRDKVLESLPDNLNFDSENGKIISNQIVTANTIWGPFDVEKISSDNNLTNIQMGSKINVQSADWVNVLLDKCLKTASKETDDCNAKIVFCKNDSQVIVSTIREIEAYSELKCDFTCIEQFPIKNLLPFDSLDSDHPSEKTSKTCKYCGINFSHQCTLEAHMSYYCSRRQTALNEPNNGQKFQKTWRTRQRNKQPISTHKSTPSDGQSFNSSGMFNDEIQKLKLLDRNLPSKLVINALNGIEVSQLETQLNKTAPTISLSSNNKKSILQPTLLPNGNSCTTAGKTVESEKVWNSNSDSEAENCVSNSLCFCAPCGLFFSNRELYNIHQQLEISSLQSSSQKFNSLVLAAPVISNNGIQYVPIHPRTSLMGTISNSSHKTPVPMTVNKPDDQTVPAPLDLSLNNNNNNNSNSSKSPIILPNDKLEIDVANRLVAAAAARMTITNCNQLIKSNKRPFQCQHCQTRFQLYSTFQAHQEFYCQGKRKQSEILIPEKRMRSSSSSNSNQIDGIDQTVKKNEDSYWSTCSQGFKCDGCGFIGQTKRGIRIHCKNQCSKNNKVSNQNSDCKSDDIDVCSPNSDNGVPSNINLQSPEIGIISQQDSIVKTEAI